MLRIGLTGGLGSGKTTAARIFHELGAHTLSADDIGRALMQPGERVFDQIVSAFGPRVVRNDGQLDRPELARRVFSNPAALQQLNCIVHPAVIVEQDRQIELISEIEPEAVVIVESALIFEVERDNTAPGWKDRFDKLILVTAPDEVKTARYLARLEASSGQPLTADQAETATADAHRRMAALITDEEKASRCDFVIRNDGTRDELAEKVAEVYRQLATRA
jgi:dephospho-CoA kinase